MSDLATRARTAARVLALAPPEQKNRALEAMEKAIRANAAAILAANAHLVYVATTSQPACVAHLRTGGGSAERVQFSAAQSSCSPLKQRDKS